MARVRIGTQIVQIGDDSYQPTEADINEVASHLQPNIGITGGPPAMAGSLGQTIGESVINLGSSLGHAVVNPQTYKNIATDIKQNPENLIPPAFALAGMPFGPAGRVGGQILGETLRQDIRQAKTGEPLNIPEILGVGITSGALEVLPAGVKALLPNTQHSKLLQVGKTLGKYNQELAILGKQTVAKTGIPASTLLTKIEQTIAKNPTKPRGAVMRVLRDWQEVFEKNVQRDATGNILVDPKMDFDLLKSFENDLGHAVKFKGGNVMPSPALNRAAIDLRSDISTMTDKMAKQMGYKDYAKLNKKYSKLRSTMKLDDINKPGFIPEVPRYASAAGLGAVVGSMTQSGSAGAGTFLGLELAQAAKIRNALYNAAVGTPAGGLSLIGAEEGMRRLLTQRQSQ